MEIRHATSRDAPAIAALIGQLDYAVTAEEVEARLSAIEGGRHAVLVAETRGNVIGCLSTSAMVVLHRPAAVGRISMMVIDEGWRGQGVGAELAGAAERLLEEQGCQLVEVTSNLRRVGAHRLWERIGYERTSARFAKTVGISSGNGG